MTKQIQLKDGKVLKVESCGKCPACFQLSNMCLISGNRTYLGTAIRDDCPLEEWQEPTAPKEQGTTTGTGGYLDKAAVLVTWDRIFYFNDFKKPIERREFDAKEIVIGSSGAWISKWQAEKISDVKDAEIARLKSQIAGHHEAIEVLLESKDKEITQLKASIKNLKYLTTYRPEYVQGLEERFMWQDQELKDLGKALQEAKKTTTTGDHQAEDIQVPKGTRYEISHKVSETMGHVDKWIDGPATIRIIAPLTKEPPKDEPELWICPKAELCRFDGCVHKKPHQRINHETGMNNCNRPGKCGGRTECIPVKKEQTVSEKPPCFGTCKEADGKITERSCLDCDFLGDCKDVFYGQKHARRENTIAGALYQAIEVEGRRIDAYAKKQINFDMRLDKLEKEIAAIKEKE